MKKKKENFYDLCGIITMSERENLKKFKIVYSEQFIQVTFLLQPDHP